MKAIIAFVVVAAFLLSVLSVGCAPAIRCEAPSKIIGNKCCLDEDDSGVCDSEEPEVTPEPEATPENEPAPEPELEAEPEPVIPQPPVVKPAPVPEPEAPALKEGKFKIVKGEPKKYAEINDLVLHRYSYDKVELDFMWYTVRNVGEKALNPEVRIRAEGARTGDSEYSSSSVERTYNLDKLEPGEKQVIMLPMGIRYGQMNKTKTLTVSVFERFVAPKEVLGEYSLDFIPRDELDSMDIKWLPED